jgi:hypothetical protein
MRCRRQGGIRVRGKIHYLEKSCEALQEWARCWKGIGEAQHAFSLAFHHRMAHGAWRVARSQGSLKKRRRGVVCMHPRT